MDDIINTEQANTQTSLQEKADEYLNGWKRALADYQNFVNDASRKNKELLRHQSFAFFLDILPMIDLYDEALAHTPEDVRSTSWFQGYMHIAKQWHSFLNKNGLTEIPALDNTFDPELHDAVETIHDPKKGDHEIVKVLSKGYTHHNSLLRPARVVVNDLTNKPKS